MIIRHELEAGEATMRVEKRGEGCVARRTPESYQPKTYALQIATWEDVPLMLATLTACEYLLDRAGLHVRDPTEVAADLAAAGEAPPPATGLQKKKEKPEPPS